MLYDIWDLEEKKEMGARNTVPTRLVKRSQKKTVTCQRRLATTPTGYHCFSVLPPSILLSYKEYCTIRDLTF